MKREDGSVLFVAGSGLVTLVVFAVVVLDLAAYVVSARRAQSAADAAALAAVTVMDPTSGGGDPRVIATRVASAWGGALASCSCEPGGRQVLVTVSMPVPAVVVTRFAARRVEATSRAALVWVSPPAPDPG